MRSHLTAVFLLFLAVTSFVHSSAQVASPANANAAVISLNNVNTPHATQYAGSTSAIQGFASGQAKPVSLAHADFDGDGIDDLVTGYAVPDGSGIISLRRGNIDAFAPQSDASWKALASHQFLSPFVSTARVFRVPAVPNFVGTGQFLGQIDLVTAAQGGNAIYILAGDGRGSFAAPQSFAVPGPVNAMATGRFGSDTQTNSILIGTGGSQPSLSLYRGSKGGLSLVSIYPLQASASAFDFDDLDGDGYPDAVMVSGGNVLILHAAASPNGSPQLETLSLPFSAAAVVSGFFAHDRGWRRQMAVLDSNSTTHIVVHGSFDPRPWAPAEVKAMRDALIHGLPNPFQSLHTGPANDGWTVLESFCGLASFGATDQVPLLLRTSFLGTGMDEVLVINSVAGQASFVSHSGIQYKRTATFVSGQQSLLPISSAPKAVVAMPVTASQLGLVMLTPNSASPSIVAAATTINFAVNATTDTVDVKPGDGVCADATGHCSLRAAVMEVNAEAAKGIAGPFQINVPKGNINLTIPGAATTDASTGHLDVNAPVSIIGAGPTETTITQTNPSGDQDTVFLVDAAEDSTPDYNIAIRGMTITGGHANSKNLVAQGGAIHWEAGVDGTGKLSLLNVMIQGNFATDPADPGLDDGGGVALFNAASVTHPAAVSISGPNTVIQNNAAFDAGGAIALRGAVSLTMTGIAVTGNQAVGDGIQQGGGLFFAVSNDPPSGATSSPSSIHGGTISGNTAGAGGFGEGGGIWTDESLTIDQGSMITGNDGGGAGGGIATNLRGATDLVTITASTITGNRTGGGNGGGIEVDAGSKANLKLSFNRVFKNTVAGTGAGTGLFNAGNGTPTATDNWWGCNGGPQSSGDGCDQVSGAASVSPSIQLAFSANPNPVLDLSSTTLTAALQDGNPNFPANLNALINLPVAFTNAVNGTLSNESAVMGTGASATATFTVSSGPTAQANVQIDNATVTATMQVSDFPLTASPTAQTINVGTPTATYQIAVGGINGFSGTVTLTIGNADGLNANISPTQIAGSGTATLTIQTASVAPGTYPSITVVGTSGNISHQVSVQLTVADFAVSVSPASQTVTLGQGAIYTVTVSSTTGFNGPITLGVNGLPSGTFVFSASVVNLAGQSSSATSELTVTEGVGAYSFTVQGTNLNNVARLSSPAQLTVNNPPPVIYRPSTFSGQYGNPQLAFDANLGTSALFQATTKNGPTVTGTEVWNGWSKPSGSPISIVLSVTSRVSGSLPAYALISYTAANGVSGTIYSSTTRAQTTDMVTLPSNVDISTLRVTAQSTIPNSFYLVNISHYVYEIFVTVVAK